MKQLVLRGLAGMVLTFWLTLAASAQTNVNVDASVLSPVDPNNSTFIASPTTVPPDGVALSRLIITARDNSGNPLASKNVTVSASDNAVTIRCGDGSYNQGSSFGVTGANGELICYARSTKTVSVEFIAVVDTVELADKPLVRFTFTSGGSGGGTTAPPQPGEGGATQEPPPGQQPPPSGVLSPPTTGSQPTTVIEKIVRAVGNALTALSEAIPSSLPAIIGIVTVIPALVTLVPVTTSISIALLGGIPAFQYLLYNLLPFFKPPKRWGTVRDAQTKVPIPGVFVTLYEAKTGKQIRRIITDQTGRFGFLAEEHEQYWVEISSPLYHKYRSAVIDGQHLKSTSISFDIYLEADDAMRVAPLKKVAKFSSWVVALNAFELTALVAGSFMAVLLIYKERTLETFLLIGLYSLLWLLRSISSTRTRRFDLVKDRNLDSGLDEVVLQVSSTDPQHQTFIHSTISDKAGRFIILVPPGKYNIIGAKQGYLPAERKFVGKTEDVQLNLIPTSTSQVSEPQAS